MLLACRRYTLHEHVLLNWKKFEAKRTVQYRFPPPPAYRKMSNSVAEKPKHPGVIPYILSPSCEKHIKWLENVFDARQTEIYLNKDKTKIMHVSLAINDGLLYMADSSCDPEKNESLPKDDEVEDTHGFWCHVELENPEVLWKKALANGSTVVFDLKKQYYGGELGCLRDPFGFNWGITKADKCRKPGVIPYFFLPDGECEKHIEWMEKALGAKRKDVYHSDNNLIQHCVLEVNGSPVYTSDISGMPGTPEAREVVAGKTKRFFCNIESADPHAVWDEALREGAKVTMELKKQNWGGDYGMFKDPFNFEWSVSSSKNPESSTAPPAGVIPYLFSPSCEKHVDWIKNIFGGEVRDMYRTDDKKIMHCSVKVNNGFLYMCDSSCTHELKCRPAGEPGGYLCHVNLADPDEIWKKAMASGATQIAELKTQFWGDYYGSFKDPYGFEWAVMKA